MDCYVTLILLFFGFILSSCSRFPHRNYYFVNLPMTWDEAQQYCREKYTDLATIESSDDVSRLPFSPNSEKWIGLRDDLKSWRWSATGETSKTVYQNWRTGEPNTAHGEENCITMGPDRKWSDEGCEAALFDFVCYTETSQTEKTYVFITEKKTWPNARDYCREHYTDLAMIENDQENNEVSAKKGSVTAWIGLYRVRWSWSDKSQRSFNFWRNGKPENFGGQEYCVVTYDSFDWDDRNCNEKQPFYCHQVGKLLTTIRMKIKTDADITDPATNTQILQQLGAALKRQGLTDFKLTWKMKPKKQEKRTEL